MSNRFGKRLVSRLMPSFLGKSDVFLFFCFIFWPKRYRDALGGGVVNHFVWEKRRSQRFQFLPPALLFTCCAFPGLRWRVRLHTAVYNLPSPPAAAVPASFVPRTFFRFYLPTSPFLLSFTQFPLSTRCGSLIHRRGLTHTWNQAEIYPGSAARFLARPEMGHTAAVPWMESGRGRQSGGRKIPLKEQMLASSWHMPETERGGWESKGVWWKEKEGF